MSKKKVYIFLADGFEDVEGLTVVDLLRRAEVDISTVSIKDTRQITTSRGITLFTDCKFMETDFSNADMLVIPGGMPGTRYLAAYEPLLELFRAFYNEGGKVAAICAAPTIFSALGFLKERKATCYPGMADQLDCGEYLEDPVVTDGNVTTSRGVGTAIPFALSLISQLVSEEKAAEIGRSIVFYT